VNVKAQRGLYLVEFAIISMVLMVLIFAALEFARVMYTYSVLNEGTRRASRIAAVCPVNDPSIAAAAGFAELPGFSASNVALSYLDQNGGSVGAPGSPAGLSTIRYVRVEVVGYTHQLYIPLFDVSFLVPAFPSVLPRESLGIVNGVSTAC
jgi:hypothetical protein